MKIFAWLLMMALTWYLAGLYQISALGLLLVVQLLLFVWMGMLSFYIKSAADAALIGKNLTVVRGQEAAIGIRIMNRGRLPLTRIRLRMEWSNPLAMDGEENTLTACCPPGQWMDVKWRIQTENCGVLQITLDQMELWDPLGLFRRIKRTSRRKYLTVLPEGRGRLFPDPMGAGVTVRYEETPRQQTDLNGTQMDRIDSYRDGDTLKSIHWKLSVRYDELMVKRYQADSGSCAALILRSDFWDKAGMEQINRFLEEEAALIRGLLEDSWQFRLLWKSEEEGRWVSHPMESREDYQGGLEQLMKELASRRKKIERKGQGTEEILRELPLEEGEIPIWLDLEGQLYMDGIPVDFTECWEETE